MFECLETLKLDGFKNGLEVNKKVLEIIKHLLLYN